MDDDLKICSLTATMLQSLDYKFDIAHNGEEAVKFYRSYFNIGRPYDAVIMDLTVIGGMGGEETFHVLKALDPDVRLMLLKQKAVVEGCLGLFPVCKADEHIPFGDFLAFLHRDFCHRAARVEG